MKAEKLNKWAELLLDTGKRNNLIHFKDTKMGSVEILSPDFVVDEFREYLDKIRGMY